MSFTDDDAARLITAMRRVAAEEILPRFRSLGEGDIRRKSHDYDLVTEADLRAEERLTEIVAHDLPRAVVIGEEAVSRDAGALAGLADAPLAVIIDPVDGTWNFANGLAVFGTIVAVTEHGRTVWGAIHDTLSDSWIEARAGGGAFRVGTDGRRTRLQLSDGHAALGDICGYSHSFLFPDAALRRLFARLPDLRRVTSLRCSAWEYRMIAEGRGEDFCLSPVLNPWDHAAGCLAIREAGGVARMIGGSDYDVATRDGRLLVARTEAIWQTLADHLEGI